MSEGVFAMNTFILPSDDVNDHQIALHKIIKYNVKLMQNGYENTIPSLQNTLNINNDEDACMMNMFDGAY